MPREHPRGSIITMDRQRNRDRSLWIFDPRSIVLRNLEIIGHDIELLAGHVEGRMIVNLHGRTIAEAAPNSIGRQGRRRLIKYDVTQK